MIRQYNSKRVDGRVTEDFKVFQAEEVVGRR
jgi:hypothetical protein